MEKCAGIILVESTQGSLGVSAEVGSGILLVKKSRNGATAEATQEAQWSLPCAVNIKSIGFGTAFGYVEKHVVIFLLEIPEKIGSVAGEMSLGVGIQAGVAAAGDGRCVNLDLAVSARGVGVTTTMAFSTKGYLINIGSSNGVMMSVNEAANEAYYGDKYHGYRAIIVTHQAELPSGKDDALEEVYDKLVRLGKKTGEAESFMSSNANASATESSVTK